MNAWLKAVMALTVGTLGVVHEPACGHHSMAEYERGAVIEFEGEVLKESWRNPHILLEVATTGADGAIEVRFEEFDAVRTIHMRDSVNPESVPTSPLGYSVGRWEGDTLVVRTTRINWPYFNRVGAPQSEAVAIEERIAAVDGGNRLDYVMTVTDPATLVGAFVWEAYWTWRPGERVRRYDCTIEAQ
jgi:hypothetical protein